MDPLLVLKQQIEDAKKRKAEEPSTGAKKWKTKKELDAPREAAYLEEQRKLEEERRKKLEAKMPVLTPKKEEEEFVCKLPVADVKRRLRKIDQPITLFGETDAQREKRLNEHEAAIALRESETATSGRNTFLDDMKSTGKGNNGKNKDDDPPSDTEEDGQLMDKDTAISRLFAPVPPATDEQHAILHYLQRLMRLYELDIESKDPEYFNTAAGKQEAAIVKQSRRWLRPLFKMLRTKTLEDDKRTHLGKITDSLREQEYVQANDWYLRMAIGNAAWPMGVTMVGIHERSAREKINTSQVAHILNDETQRCYIQAVKRLITFQQKLFPAAPSKQVG